MARRRLLTILTSSAVLTAALCGPAAAIELADTTGDTITEVVDTTDEAVDEAIAEVAAEPVEESVGPVVGSVVDEAVQVVAPEESASSPEPEARSEEESAPAVTGTDELDDALVTAGSVDAAPALASLTGPTGVTTSEPSRLELQLSLSNPDTGSAPGPAAPVRDVVEAPQVAPADVAEVASRVTTVLQSATTPTQDGGTSIVAVALAALLAAGLGILRGGREAVTA